MSNPSTIKKEKVYFENLDGLRFFCFLAVFLFHSFHSEYDYILNNSWYQFIAQDLFGNGRLGVNFFFVLSGFLISYLLLKEKTIRGNVDVGRFYIRRILRIWPLYYCCVFFGFVIFPWLKSTLGAVPNETANPWYYMFFVSNFDFIRSGLPDASVLGVLWSIAVEEQFYLTWPLIFFALPKERLELIFPLIIASSVAFRASFDAANIHEMHTLSCIGDMAIGGWGAFLVYTKEDFKASIINIPKWAILFLYALLIVIFLFRDEAYQISWWRPVERLFIAFTFLMVILEQTYAKHSFYKMKNIPLVGKLGRISYGLYCLHFIGILITLTITRKLGLNDSLGLVLILETAIALLTTILISAISYRVLERPFLKLKNRFSYITKNDN